MDRQSDRPPVSFVVTGFGPFRGVSNNPTTIIIEKLVSDLWTRAGSDKPGGLNNTTPVTTDHQEWKEIATNTTALIFETSATIVREKMDAIVDDISGALDVTAQPSHIVFLHLGVNFRGEIFQIERYGYNDASFR